MACPKKKTSSSKQGHTRSHWKAKVSILSECDKCHEPKLPHTICTNCGYYRKKQIVSKE